MKLWMGIKCSAFASVHWLPSAAGLCPDPPAQRRATWAPASRSVTEQGPSPHGQEARGQGCGAHRAPGAHHKGPKTSHWAPPPPGPTTSSSSTQGTKSSTRAFGSLRSILEDKDRVSCLLRRAQHSEQDQGHSEPPARKVQGLAGESRGRRTHFLQATRPVQQQAWEWAPARPPGSYHGRGVDSSP